METLAPSQNPTPDQPPADPMSRRRLDNAAEPPKLRWFIVALLLVLALGLGTWVFLSSRDLATSPATTEEPIATTTTIYDSDDEGNLDTTGWKTYRNEEHGFEFRYPAESQSILLYNEPQNSKWNLPKLEGTNLVSKTLYLVLADGPSDCTSPVGGEVTPVVKTPFVLQRVGDGGAGHFFEEYRYITQKESYCIALTFGLESVNYEGVMRGTGQTPPLTFDKTGEMEIFNQILSTFRFLK